jgi:mannose-6-phosphate isomerase-like protein (cupin superfamily)
MNETTFLNGKVRKRSLPLFKSPPPNDATGPKRLLLSQGELANLYDADEGIRYLALIELRLGAVRGNHLHRVKEEQVYLISGELVLVVQQGEAGERVYMELHPGDLVEIDTGVAHAIKPTEAGYAIEFSRTRFDPADVQRVTLI